MVHWCIGEKVRYKRAPESLGLRWLVLSVSALAWWAVVNNDSPPTGRWHPSSPSPEALRDVKCRWQKEAAKWSTAAEPSLTLSLHHKREHREAGKNMCGHKKPVREETVACRRWQEVIWWWIDINRWSHWAGEHLSRDNTAVTGMSCRIALCIALSSHFIMPPNPGTQIHSKALCSFCFPPVHMPRCTPSSRTTFYYLNPMAGALYCICPLPHPAACICDTCCAVSPPMP